MNRDEPQVAAILHELQERAKELNCLYRVDELLNQPELSLEQHVRQMLRSRKLGDLADEPVAILRRLWKATEADAC